MTEKSSEFFRVHWPAVVAILAAAVAWGTNTAQVASLNEGQRRMVKTQEVVATKLDSILEGVAETKVTGRYAKEELLDLRSRVHALEARR